MTKAISRAQFLRGDFTGQRSAIRPPWSGSERRLRGQCTRCDACIQNCPEQILIRDKKGFPQIDFSRGECSFCAACATSCQAGVFDEHTSTPAWSLKALMNNDCLPLQGVVCSRCAEECEAGSIKLKLVAGGIAIPIFETASCTGCGGCYRVCPGSAITMSYQELNETSAGTSTLIQKGTEE